MSLRVETDLLRRILAASLPAGARAAELFIESRIGLDITFAAGEAGSDPVQQVERRWETGAHLRRFSEGRHESFVLDAPSPEALEALALHPEAVALSWLDGSPAVGVSRERAEESAHEMRLSDASPTAEGGPWSDRCLTAAAELLREWLASLESQAARAGVRLKTGASLHVHLQEILVVATDRDPARDTRSFVEATLKARVSRGDRSFAAEETLRAISLQDLVARARELGADPAGEPPASALLSRCLSGLDAVAAPRGEMPVVFAS
ncbi:MAG TPA: hypothetical protein VFG76_03560, partial [Candidatus Polarisedimenticolia bacterium]|nr:hypothetical protein [Candidatus Polarisedimenticolia bacterium]